MSTFGLPIWMIVFWLFVVGAAVGSFLNVVVYRLPLGISLVYPPSRCPKCGKHIAWYDNIPILGWIMLWGRCRQCHNVISARYPIVEAITAAMFAAVAAVEICQPYDNDLRLQFYHLYPFHIVLLSTLLCASLMEYDGIRPPVKLFVPALAVGALAPLFWPALRPWPACGLLPMWLAGIEDFLVSLAAGALLGGIAWRVLRSQKPVGLTLGLICVGLFVGRAAAGMIALGTAVLEIAVWLPERAAPRAPSLWLGIVTLLWILAVCNHCWPSLFTL